MVGKNLSQSGRTKRLESDDASGTAEQRLLAVFKNLVHQRMYRTANQQVHLAFVLMQVPIMLHLAKNRSVDPLKLLELVDDQVESPPLGKQHQIFEQFAKRQECATSFVELGANLFHKLVAQQRLGLSGDKEIQCRAAFTALDEQSRLSDAPAPRQDRHLPTVFRHLFYRAMYYRGEGADKNLPEAFAWYKKAAEQNNTAAQAALGDIYRRGDGMEKDTNEAMQWYKKAAEHGNTQASLALGEIYLQGEGVSKDAASAFKWFKQAAEHNSLEAQMQLGDLYRTGGGVAKDAAAAFKWYKKAAAQNNAEAQMRLGDLYRTGGGVTKDAAAAFKWYKKAAEQNNAEAQMRLGDLYRTGGGVTKDAAAALKWYKKAAEQDNTEAQFNIGCMYLSGEGVAKSGADALKWLEKAGNAGSEQAQFKLGDMYYDGIGVPVDKSKGFAWFKKCAMQGNAKAEYTIGMLYYKGSGVPKDKQSAVKWFEQAAEKGFAQAQYDLGCMYEEGDGVGKDEAKAERLFKQACDQNHTDALYKLGGLQFRNGNSAGLNLTRKAADLGNGNASLALALVYMGKPEYKDDYEAFRWCRRAYDQGEKAAAPFLVYMYLGGIGTSSDPYMSISIAESTYGTNSAFASNIRDIVDTIYSYHDPMIRAQLAKRAGLEGLISIFQSL